ncbi:probable RNA-binding protein EIF1AD isoform X2 [Melopsittacus undulatus]|uniref:probable RNA-binding protein EIF1AD isoform X2 n=1 Tax=Melopsittacus undulatus TaxID=13146 RepID=UPI00146B2571|nr:probable RNA-binding protein EIF1AD isoform X2 [Melopsittacus undulatus]
MSRATKRKHVVRELLEEHVMPAPRQRVVRVLGTPGNNLHEVETPEGMRFLASMPPRFRRHIWIKRGDFLLVDPIEEGAKVKAEISLVLLPPHVRFLQRQGLWPEAFAPLERPNREGHPPDGDCEGEGGLFVNTNRGAAEAGDSEESCDEEEESCDEEEESCDKEEETCDKQEDSRDEDNTRDEEDDTCDEEDNTHDEEDTCDKGDTRDQEKDTRDQDTRDQDTHDEEEGTRDKDDTRDQKDPRDQEHSHPKDTGDQAPRAGGDRGDAPQ